MNLSDLYDGDRRTRDPEVRRVATSYSIPHPLHGVQYGDGADRCTHAKRCTNATGKAAR